MLTRFSFNVQTLRICCAAWQCIFSTAYPSYETWVITLPFVFYCVMIDAEQRIDRFYTNLAGSENDLNHVLSTFVDSEHEITNFCHSHYVDMSEIQSIFQNSQNEFLLLTLNIQSVNAKFDNLVPVIDNLSSTWNKIDSLTQALLDMSLWESKMSQALLEEFIPAARFATLDPTMST